MFCTKCGTTMEEGIKFCPQCGTSADGAPNPSARVASPTEQRPKKKGMPTWGIVLIVLACLFIPAVGILAAIAIPHYQDYTIRARVSEALTVVIPAKTAVTEFVIRNNKNLPLSLEQVGFKFASSEKSSVQSVGYDNKTGSIFIFFKPTSGVAEGTDPAMVFRPSVDENDNIVWACEGSNIKRKHVPSACKN